MSEYFEVNESIGIGSQIRNLGTPCMVCGESVKLFPHEVDGLNYGRSPSPKICNKCKRTIMYMRALTDVDEEEVARVVDALCKAGL